MSKVLIKSMAVIFLVLGLNGCGVAKVYNVESKPLKELISENKMESKIKEACKVLGWNIVSVQKNKILASITLRSHSASISIKYDKNSFAISLINAINLQYNKENNTIHSNYNGWIKNLKNQIEGRIEPLKMDDDLKKKEILSALDKKKYFTNSFETGFPDIYDVMHKKIIRNHSLEEVSQGIVKAGQSLTWIMQKQQNGFILGKIIARTHSAIVKINFTQNSYSITYITSENLNYRDYTIHKNYNGWIKNLEGAIDSQLSF